MSIAAGVTLGRLEELLGTDRLIRVMPNTPALVGEGAAAFATAAGATEEDAAVVEEMLGSVGICVRVAEDLMDAVTGLSGSGPAYIYLVIEALADGGAKMGLPQDVASALAAQTVLGAARMVLKTGRAPKDLRDDVTTPGGTTVEGLRVLEESGVPKALADAVAAATEKSRLLAGGPSGR
ncbi:MAG: pyrroline-5-carboxylate reductase [Planctomycetota bacterium]